MKRVKVFVAKSFAEIDDPINRVFENILRSFEIEIKTGDEPEPGMNISKKIQNMITDPKRIKLSDVGHPQACNVFSYYEVFAPDKKTDVSDWCKNAKTGCTGCKSALAEEIIKYLLAHQARRRDWLGDKNKLEKILQQGREKAAKIAAATAKEARQITGLI